MTIFYEKLTRYVSHQQPTMLDHEVTNIPQVIGDNKTSRTIISDHCALTFDFLKKNNILKPRFKTILNFKALTMPTL